MRLTFDMSSVAPLREKLNQHPVYGALQDLDDLRRFMSHHIYSVWDFMSIVKYLQRKIAPTEFPWAPIAHPSVRRFINSIVLEEESDEGLPDADGNPTFCSHFELYCAAMKEIGADTTGPLKFVEIAHGKGIRAALDAGIAPAPSHQFMETTFGFIDNDKPHLVAAAFSLGREQVIPGMFRSILGKIGITEKQAPAFHYYLHRHIHLDEDFHGPLSLLMLDELCEDDPLKFKEAEVAAAQAIEARLRFWDGVLAALR
jgi:hypothetical protein